MSEIDYYKEVTEFLNFVGNAKVKPITNVGTVISANEGYNTYPTIFGYTFASDKLEQVCGFMGCRDYLHDAIRTFLNNKKRLSSDYHSYANDKNEECPDLFMDEMLLLVQMNVTGNGFSVKNAEKAIKVLNDIEEFCGIPFTTAEEVTIDCHSLKKRKNIKHILLRGSGMYMCNPHMLSIVTLIIRFCSYSKYGWYRKPADLVKWMDTKKANITDTSILRRCYKSFAILVKNRDYLFKGLEIDELFPIDSGFSFHSSGGIAALCNADTQNKEVNKKAYVMDRAVKKNITKAGKKSLYRKIVENFIL